MQGKKGDFAFGLYFWPSLFLLIMTLVIFTILFFFIGVKSDKVVINSQMYEDNSKLLTLARSPTNVQIDNKNLTISELISLANKDPNYIDKLKEQTNSILIKMPKPTNKASAWSLNIQVKDKSLLSIENSLVGSADYFNQKLNIPLENSELAKMNLYFSCRLCKEEDLKEFA